jgi:hypothetical protein
MNWTNAQRFLKSIPMKMTMRSTQRRIITFIPSSGQLPTTRGWWKCSRTHSKKSRDFIPFHDGFPADSKAWPLIIEKFLRPLSKRMKNDLKYWHEGMFKNRSSILLSCWKERIVSSEAPLQIPIAVTRHTIRAAYPVLIGAYPVLPGRLPRSYRGVITTLSRNYLCHKGNRVNCKLVDINFKILANIDT